MRKAEKRHQGAGHQAMLIFWLGCPNRNDILQVHPNRPAPFGDIIAILLVDLPHGLRLAQFFILMQIIQE